MITTLLFDLDGTLLPMDTEVFTKHYFSLLVQKLAPYGYEAKPLIGAVLACIEAMAVNDGSVTNEEAFWNCFASLLGEQTREQIPVFEDFYANEFQQIKVSCGYNPMAKQVIELAKQKGLRTILATNPIFPSIATESRIRWAGLQPEDFELYTTYEDQYYCKPNVRYYEEILKAKNLKPEECMMIGNDVVEDLVAAELGIRVFLLTDCLINKKQADISEWEHGGFPELYRIIECASARR